MSIDCSLKRKAMETSSGNSGTTTLSTMPSNLEEMDHGTLVQLFRTVVSERDELKSQLDKLREQQQPSAKKMKQQQPTLLEPSAASCITPPKSSPTASELTAIRKRFGKNATKMIKKCTYSGQRKPIVEFSEGNIFVDTAVALMKEYIDNQSSNTARMTKWKLSDDTDIANFLCTEKLIHPAKHDGKGFIFFGSKPKIYGWAKYDTMEVKYDKREQTFHLKIKTAYAGSGRPEFAPQLVAYSMGVSNYLGDDE